MSRSAEGFWTAIAGGQSVRRWMLTRALRRWRPDVRGVVVDLASGKQPPYLAALGLLGNPGVRLLRIDIDPAVRPRVIADLRWGIPVQRHAADVVIISGFLTMVPEPGALLREVRRVLRPGATLVLTVPLVFPSTRGPDYWRFTEQGLRYLLGDAGFERPTVIAVGGFWTGAISLLETFLRPRWLVAPIVCGLCLQLDRLTQRLVTRQPPVAFAARAYAPLEKPPADTLPGP